MTYSKNNHVPVLLDDILKVTQEHLINNCSDGEKINNVAFFDGTFGGGGYFSKLYNLFDKNKIEVKSAIAVDLDQNAKVFFDELKLKNSIFLNTTFDTALLNQPLNSLDLIVLDLGFSTNQLELSEIGLSYKKLNQDFDLRFNTDVRDKNNIPAWLKLRSVKSEHELMKIIYNNSGEEFSRNIARNIFNLPQLKQKLKLFNRDINNCILDAVPIKFHKKINSIFSRVYQAFRIWVNNELGNLSSVLDIFETRLKKNGLLVIVSFHSLEDKLITKKMRELSSPKELDEFGNKSYDYLFLTKKGITPCENELLQNNASRSGVLRVLKKL